MHKQYKQMKTEWIIYYTNSDQQILKLHKQFVWDKEIQTDWIVNYTNSE